MRQNPGARLTEYDVAGLVNTAFTEVARLEIAQNGFRCTGIKPFDLEIFSDLDFLGSALTDIPLIDNQADQSTTQVCCHAAAIENEPEQSTRSTLQRETPRSSVNTEDVRDVLKILSPLPDASKKRPSVRKRRTQESETLTSSPFKNELKEKTKGSRTLPNRKNVKSLSNKENPTPEPRSHDQKTEFFFHDTT